MAALLLLLLTAAWAGDGLLRQWADARLQRKALVGWGAHALSGVVLLACAVELALPIPLPLARDALHALALALVGATLAPDDAVPPRGDDALRRLRELAPAADALLLALLGAWLLAAPGHGPQAAMRLVAWTGLVLFVRMLAPPLDARLATAGSGARLHWARLGTLCVLALALLGMRAWLP